MILNTCSEAWTIHSVCSNNTQHCELLTVQLSSTQQKHLQLQTYTKSKLKIPPGFSILPSRNPFRWDPALLGERDSLPGRAENLDCGPKGLGLDAPALDLYRQSG